MAVEARTRSLVLTVDDSKDIQALLRLRLGQEGLEARTALDGPTGIELAKKERPALILLDIDMPGMDGFETLRALKGSDETSSIPVIVLSGEASASDKVMGLDLGAVDYVSKPFDNYELMARVRAALRTQRLMEMLARRAQIDGLTGLFNRAHFEKRVVEVLSQGARLAEQTALAICDVDKFKSINDTFGHPAGDAVLQGFAELMQQSVRSMDSVFRFGGEEFVVLMPKTPPEEAATVMERIRVALSECHWPRHPERVVTASFGIAIAEIGVLDARAVLASADKALYAAKEGGRNRVVVAGLNGAMITVSRAPAAKPLAKAG
ncbi:MAG: diguanylate cyclase [Phycisphaerales bacterium]